MMGKVKGIGHARYLLIGLFVLAGLAIVLLFASQTGEAVTLIYDVDDLQNMNLNLTEDYELANNIDASTTSGWNWDVSYFMGFNPVGNLSAAFTGNFSGNGYTISNLYIDRYPESYVGLFGAINGPYGNIKDVTLENADITGNDYTGTLVGHTNASGIIENCNVSGTVLGDNTVGGMIGRNQFGGVTNCVASVDVTLDSEGGGLIAWNENSPVTYSYATGDVTGLVNSYYYGGLVGKNWDSDITYCYATGNVNAAYRVGGLVGSHAGNALDIISLSYATGDVFGTQEQIGGFIGWNNWGAIENCYSLGDVTGNIRVGGFVGENRWATITNSYSTGFVTGNTDVGGFCGFEDGNTLTTEGFWDLNTSGQATSVNGTGKNTTELLMTSTYTGAGWDLTNDWWMLDNETRPFLRMEYSTKIRTTHQLQLMLLDLGADYSLEVDLDMGETSIQKHKWGTTPTSGNGFVPVGNNSDRFTGSFESNGYTINDLYINRPTTDYVGLFGYIDTGGTVSNVVMNNVNMTGYNNVGAIAGIISTQLDDCHSSGIIIGYDWVGGLAGSTSNDVTNSTSSVTVDGHYYIGGLVGDMTGSIFSNCDFTSAVSGSAYIGGMTGQTSNTDLIDCHSTGTANGGDFLGGLVGSVTGGNHDRVWVSGDVDGNQWVGGLYGWTTGNGVIINATYSGVITATSSNSGGIVGLLGSGFSLSNSNSSAIITGQMIVGGLVGNNQGNIFDTNSTGSVSSGVQNAGGLAGRNTGTITNSFSTALVNCPSADWVGGLVGFNDGAINNTYATGTVTGDQYVAGITGETQSTVLNSDFFGVVNGNDGIGGIVGRSVISGTILDCNNYGTINGGSVVGGIAGLVNAGLTVDDCHSTGDVTGVDKVGGLIGENNGIVGNSTTNCNTIGTGLHTGGLVGLSTGSVTNCQAYGYTTGNLEVGGLIGWNNGGTVTLSNSFGLVNGTDDIGGLIGWNTGIVTNCSAYGDATGVTYVGGLIGYNDGGTVIDCGASGDATGIDNIGGLIADNSVATSIVTRCNATGKVTGTGGYSGGLIGENGGTVNDSWADVETYGFTEVGGLIGYNHGTGTITNCIAYGAVTGTGNNVGGLIGYNSGGSITFCEAYGDTTGSANYTGGLIGWSNGDVTNCTAYGNTNGTDDYVGGLIGFNSGAITNCTTHGYTTGNLKYTGGLIGNHNSGAVTECTVYGDIYGVNTFVGGLLGYNNNGDISNCIVYGNTTGAFNYNGGLIGRNSGTVTHCSVFGTVGQNVNWVGGLIGQNLGGGTVENSTYNGIVSGNFYVGGLIGLNAGTVETSYSKGSINGLTNVGGLIGLNSGTVTNCYSHTDVDANNRVGGLIGNNTGVVTNCYSKGNVIGSTDPGGLIGFNFGGTVTNCFWDNETSGWLTSDGGTGKITKVMMQQGTFTSAGWDFANIWGIIEANTYPYLLPLESYPPASADLEITITDMPDPALLGGTLDYYVNVTGRGPDNSGLVVVTIDLPSEVSYVSDDQGIGPPVGNTLTWNIGSLNNGETVSCYIEVTIDSYGTGTITSLGSVVSVTADPGVYTNSTFNDTVVNRLPTAFDDFYTVDEDTVLNVVAPGPLGNDTDPDPDTLTVTAYDTTSTLGAAVTMNANGSFTYDPTVAAALQALSVGEWLLDTFQYTIDDGGGGTDVAVVTINVTGVNDVPSASDDFSSTDEETVLSVAAPGVLANDNDPDPSDTLTIIAFDSASKMGVAITLNPDGSYNYDPTGLPIFQVLAAGESLIDSFNYTISDGKGGITNATVFITVNGMNDEPTANDDANTIDEDTVLNIVTPGVLGNDTDLDTSDMLTVIDFDGLSTYIAIITVNANGSFSYDPTSSIILQALASGENLVDSFNYTVSDGNGGTANATVSITVNGMNDDPTANDDANTIDGDTVLNVVAPGVMGNDMDPETSDILTVIDFDTLSTNGASVTVNADGSYSYDATGVSAFQALAAGEWAVDTFQYTIDDGNGGTDTAIVTINVTGVNDWPTANDDTETIDEDTLLNVSAPGVLVNDSDSDTIDALIVIPGNLVTLNGASVGINADGSYTYDPTGSAVLQALAVGESLVDSFNYTVSDGNGGTANATVSITVNGVNDIPIPNDETWVTDEDSVLEASAPGLLADDTDLDTSDGLTVIDFDNTTTFGITIIVNADGSYTYDSTGSAVFQALAEDENLVDSFNYTIDDGNGGTATATVYITVNGVNDYPTITITDMIETVGDQLYSVDYNATDIDTSDILTWSLSSNATWLEINLTTGILEGSPTNMDTGQYWVNISVSDGKGGVHWTNFGLVVLLDTDGDKTPDIDDTDDDGDGVIDVDDDFPLDPDEDTDTDGDGTGNNADTDDDDDGLLDTEEDVNDNGVVNEGETDPLDPDTDGDEHNDLEDYAPLDPDIWKKPVETEEELPIAFLLIPIIVIIVLVLLMMLLRKGKSGEELPAEEEVSEEDLEALEDEEELSDEEPEEDTEGFQEEGEGGWEETETEEEEESGDAEAEVEEEEPGKEAEETNDVDKENEF